MSPTREPDGAPPPAAGPLDSTRSVEVADLSIPLFEGGGVELTRFQGRVVVLELSASYAAGWAEIHQHYRSLLDTHGEDVLSVITVSLDSESGELAGWERDPPPFTLGWDPQGALAARLGVTRLPTVFVLDQKGRVVDEVIGDSAALIQAVDRAVGRALEGSR